MKNAGTTISSILKREFRESYVDLHGAFPESTISSAELLSFLQNHPQVRAISSHHLRFPKPRKQRLHLADCCLLRHPLDRLHSLYHFFHTSEDNSTIGRWARQNDPPRFFCLLMEQFPNYLCNVQTTYLGAGGCFLYPPGQDEFTEAVRVIRRCSLPGVVHGLDQSLVTAEYFLHPLFPGLQLHYEAQNVRRGTGKVITERERELRDLCGVRVFRQLQALNQLDSKLVQVAEEEVQRRSQLVPSFAARLSGFQKRCAQLHLLPVCSPSTCIASH